MDEYLGIYRAKVESNQDKTKQGRVQIRVLPFMDNAEKNSLPWAIPMWSYGGAANKGICFIPDEGDLVMVFFEKGDPLMPVYIGAASFKDALPKEAQDNDYPDNKVIKTKKTTIQYNDKKDETKIETGGWTIEITGNKMTINSKDPSAVLEVGNNSVKQLCNNLPQCLFTFGPHVIGNTQIKL